MKLLLIVTGILVFCSGFAQPLFNVRKMGAKGNGLSDDTWAIQNAIDKASSVANSIVYFPPGTYLIKSFTTTRNYLENYCLRYRSNITFKGAGSASKLKLASHLFSSPDSNATAHLFYGSQVSNVSFRNLYIDMNGSQNLVPPKVIKNNSAIFASYGNNIDIKNITIKNCSGTNMINIMNKGKGLRISNSKFINGGYYVGSTKRINKYQYDFSFIYSEWEHTLIDSCTIKQENVPIAIQLYTGGVELHGSYSSLTNSTIVGCFPAVYITSSNEGTLTDVKVLNNEMKQCTEGISFWLMNEMKNISIQKNEITLIQPRYSSPNAYAIKIPNGNTEEHSKQMANGSFVTGLRIINNRVHAQPMNVLSGGFMLHSIKNAVIEGNQITGVNHAGIALLGSKWGSNAILVQNNSFFDFTPIPVQSAVPGYIIVTDTYSTGKRNAAGFKNIVVKNNRSISKNKQAKTIPQLKSTFIALPQKQQDEVKLIDNRLNSASVQDVRVVTPP